MDPSEAADSQDEVIKDIEDWGKACTPVPRTLLQRSLTEAASVLPGAVEVTEKCCGAMACRVLAPEIFIEAKGGEQTKVLFRCLRSPLLGWN